MSFLGKKENKVFQDKSKGWLQKRKPVIKKARRLIAGAGFVKGLAEFLGFNKTTVGKIVPKKIK